MRVRAIIAPLRGCDALATHLQKRTRCVGSEESRRGFLVVDGCNENGSHNAPRRALTWIVAWGVADRLTAAFAVHA